jgi:hypothetical protein
MAPGYGTTSTESPCEARSASFARRATWILLTGALAAMVGCCWLVDFDRILRRTADDAYYYFEIAENVADGNGATFDGIHKTSGFQPLWMLCLTPLFWICPNMPETAVRIGLSMQAAALFAAGALIVSVLSKSFPWKVVLGVTICYTFSIFVLAINGMETAVEILALATLFAYGGHAEVFCADRPSILKEFLFGILLGVVMLSRLDMVFLGAAIVAFRVGSALSRPLTKGTGSERKSGNPTENDGREVPVPVLQRAVRTPGGRLRNLGGAALVFVGASLVVAPYLLYNHATFGSASPISGTLKSGFPHISLGCSWAALEYCVGLPKMLLLALILAFALLYAGWYLVAARSARDARFYFHTSMAVLACAIVLHGLHVILFMKWAIWTWHFFPYFLFAALAIAAPLEKLVSTRVGGAVYWWAISGLVAAGVLGYGLRMTVSGRAPTWQTVSYEAALWARGHTDPSDVFALKDAGNFGFFSRRRVINLDGVVNNLEFQDVLKNRRLDEYFRRNRVKYLVLHGTKDEHPRVFDGTYTSDSAVFQSQLYGTWSDSIPLRKRDEVYRAAYSYKTRDDFVVWDISFTTGAP